MIRLVSESLTSRLVALALAAVYFLFQTEPFDEEYEANHRAKAESAAFASSSITWESFDKDNAPQAFVIDVTVTIELLHLAAPEQRTLDPLAPSFQPIRDKSPPLFS